MAGPGGLHDGDIGDEHTILHRKECTMRIVSLAAYALGGHHHLHT
jgi:hypothetical protein